MKLMFCLTAGTLAAASVAGAQTPQRITYDDAVTIALKQSVSVKQAENATQLSDATVKQQQKQFLPNLTVTHAQATAESGGLSGRPTSRVDSVPSRPSMTYCGRSAATCHPAGGAGMS